MNLIPIGIKTGKSDPYEKYFVMKVAMACLPCLRQVNRQAGLRTSPEKSGCNEQVPMKIGTK